MDTQITTIKHELERRFSLSAKIVKKMFDEDEIHVIFPAVFDYLSFVENTPLLQELISEDRARQEDLHTELLFDHIDKPNVDTIMDMNYDNFNDFHLCNKYDYLKEFIYDPIYRLNREIDPSKMDKWGLALIKSPYRVLTLPIPWKEKIEVIRNKIKRGDADLHYRIHKTFSDVHNRLLSLLAEYETKPKNELVKIEPTAAVTQLGLTPESQWEDLEITFRNKFEVRIKYKNKEFVTNYEDMGFSDKRKLDETKPKGSWSLLYVLSVNNGIFPLANVTGKDRANAKKQKQALTKSLKQYFQIPTDPFYGTDKDTLEYKIKIKLIPDPDFREDYRDRNMYETTKKPREFLRPVS